MSSGEREVGLLRGLERSQRSIDGRLDIEGNVCREIVCGRKLSDS